MQGQYTQGASGERVVNIFRRTFLIDRQRKHTWMKFTTGQQAQWLSIFNSFFNED